MTKTNTPAVETAKKTVAKIDTKAVAESLEMTFKTDKSVDVIADSKLAQPKSFAQGDYRYIHFYNPGTQKDMFGCYIIGKGKVRFALSLSVAEFLDKTLTIKPVEKKVKGEKRQVAIDVICDIQDAADVAKKIISAYQQKPAKPAKAEKKQEKKTTKTAEPKKPAATKSKATKAAPKKAANK